MIGSFLTDVLMWRNCAEHMNCRVIVLGRSRKNAECRFNHYMEEKALSFIPCDVAHDALPDLGKVDYIFHLASNTHPVAYARDPIGTMTANIMGTNQLLSYGAAHQTNRFVFASSVEIYGENRGDCAEFTEDYCGYINCNTLRAGYPESKRAGEAMCQAYICQEGMDVVIPRLSRTYGPTMRLSDTKALSQFIRCALAGEDIVLKSEGKQLFSYSYVADAVSGMLYCLCYGGCGEAYNIADSTSNIRLRDLAELVARISDQKVVFHTPAATESAGFSKVSRAVQSGEKLEKLGWRAQWNLEKGISQTLEILKRRGVSFSFINKQKESEQRREEI